MQMFQLIYVYHVDKLSERNYKLIGQLFMVMSIELIELIYQSDINTVKMIIPYI